MLINLNTSYSCIECISVQTFNFTNALSFQYLIQPKMTQPNQQPRLGFNKFPQGL